MAFDPNKAQGVITKGFRRVAGTAERNTGVDITPQKFILTGAGLQALKPKLFDELEVEQDQAVARSLLGTPVFANIEFPPGQYTDIDGNVRAYEGLRIDSALITVSQSKAIITTGIVGRNGTIKEYIADGDYFITINGLIIGETLVGAPQSETGFDSNGAPVLQKRSIGNRYPEDDVKRLIGLCQVPEALEVRSKFLKLFGSFNVVIESYDFPESRGVTNGQLFNLRLLSDTPIELQ